MAVLRLHYKNAVNPEQTFTCAPFDFSSGWRLRGQSGNTLSITEVHTPNLDQPWFGLILSSSCVMRDSEEGRFQIFDPTLGDELIYNINKTSCDIQRIGGTNKIKIKDDLMTEIFPGYEGNISDAPVTTKVAYERLRTIFNTDRDILLYTKYQISGDFYGYAPLNPSSTLPESNVPAYYQCSAKFSGRWISNDGLYLCSFGLRNMCRMDESRGVVYSGADTSDFRHFPTDAYNLTCGGVPCTGASSFQFQWNAASYANLDWMDTEVVVPFGNSKLVHFIMPAGTYSYGSGYSFTLTEDKIMFGVAGYTLSQTGEPNQVRIQALEQKCWKSAEHRITDMGEDTKPAGGNGPFALGTDNPLGSIARAKKQGISTNPTQSGGFYVFKFTEEEWSNFTNTLTQVWNIGYDINNIKFVYRSPLNFTTVPYNLSGLWLGLNKVTGPNGAALPTMNVVQSTVIEGSAITNGDTVWPAQTFLDLEPYASTSIQIPFCARVDIPPSLLNDKSIKVNYSYELLTRAASATVILTQNGGGTTHFSSFGECAAEQPTVLAKNAVGEVGKQLAPVITSGVASVATGGTIAPAALATATGAATGFALSSVDFVKSNLPAGSSSGPYWDTVNGGQCQCSVLGVKTQRFTSGESNDTERAKLIGYKSGYYIPYIRDLGNGTYFEIQNANIQTTYMTKGEADKLKALMREGVIL